MSRAIDSNGFELRSYVATPEEPTSRGVVLLHGIPSAPREVASAGLRYSELADRIADQCSMVVVTFNFRGTGQSEGDFSLAGWLTDIEAAIKYLRKEHKVSDVWIAGFGAGGAVGLYETATNDKVRGIATFSARAHFDDWAVHAPKMLEHCRNFGMIRNDDFPPDLDAWAADFRRIRPLDVVSKIAPRPMMIVHGNEDERVPVQDARELAAAAGDNADLRIIHGASHRLRHDPRVVALLLGWLEEQR